MTSSSAVILVVLALGQAGVSSGNRHLVTVKGHAGLDRLKGNFKAAGTNASANALSVDLGRVSNHSALLLEGGADPCKCAFKGVCSCQAAVEFMQCISTACESGMCECGGNHHFVQACTDMSSACPSVGLKCEAEQAQCMGDLVPLKAVEKKKAPVSAPVKKEEKAAEAPKEAVLVPTGLSFKDKLKAFVAHIFVMLLLAWLYDKYRHRELAFPQEAVSTDAPGFQYHLFGCFADWRTSLVTVCCPQLRWSDTVDKANLGRYWYMVVIWILLTSFYDYHAGGLAGLVLVCVATHYRQKLRKVYQAKVGGITILEDFCVYTWCGCCAMVQEARQVESMEVGYGK